MTQQTTRHPLPAPLPHSSQAGRGEIPTFDPYGLDDRDEDPRAPMREDDFTLVLCGSMVGFFILIMTAVAAMGGL